MGWWLIGNGTIVADYNGYWNDPIYGNWLIQNGKVVMGCTGKWHLVSFLAGGQEYDAASNGFDLTMVLNDDGTLLMTQKGDTSSGTWKVEGEQITIMEDNGASSAGYVTAENLYFSDGSITMVFGR